jgi:hypothetical protein
MTYIVYNLSHVTQSYNKGNKLCYPPTRPRINHPPTHQICTTHPPTSLIRRRLVRVCVENRGHIMFFYSRCQFVHNRLAVRRH